MQQKLFAIASDEASHYSNPRLNRVESEDQAFHNWYRFVLSFPPHLVRHYLAEVFGLQRGDHVLDPFCGTGTTAVEAKLLELNAVGIEANPMAHFASTVKTDWSIKPETLISWAHTTAEAAIKKVRRARVLRTLPADAFEILLKDCIEPVPLHKLLILRETIDESAPLPAVNFGLLALAKVAVQTASNLHFGPEVGVKGHKLDAPVIEAWLAEMLRVSNDLAAVQLRNFSECVIHKADARISVPALPSNSIAAVFTSPPYPNEKDYTRTTRLESVLLRFLNSRTDLRALKQGLMRSNTRNIYKTDTDHLLVSTNARIEAVANEIEQRRLDLGKTSGFERLYARVTRAYFGGMMRHLKSLKPKLRAGAYLGYVVGDQASYFRVHIETGSILAEIAEGLGYRHVRTDLFRTRLATATGKQLREEVVVLQLP